MQSVERKVRTPDGRLLSVLTAGPPGGDTVLFLHGTPGVLEAYEPHVEAGARRGLGYLASLRPGYGESDRQPGRLIADCAPDIEAIADALGIEGFYVIGESGGGSPALAFAAMYPHRVRAVAVLAGIAPIDAEGLDWEKRMGEGNRREFAAARKGPEVLRPYLENELRSLRSVETVTQLLAALDGHLCDADRAAVEGAFGEFLLAAWRRIGKGGVEGWLDDDLAHVEDWGVDLNRVAAPVTVWHGSEDLFVPVAHGQWLAEHLPNAELRLLPGIGHISLTARYYDAVLDALVASDSWAPRNPTRRQRARREHLFVCVESARWPHRTGSSSRGRESTTSRTSTSSCRATR